MSMSGPHKKMDLHFGQRCFGLTVSNDDCPSDLAEHASTLVYAAGSLVHALAELSPREYASEPPESRRYALIGIEALLSLASGLLNVAQDK